jgi:predicted metal-dependent HD superfamily phosphohydrolase
MIVNMELRQIFIQLVNTYTGDESIAAAYWKEIEKRYNGPKRYYHTTIHLEKLIGELNTCKHLITDWDTLLFSVFYHDIIYNVLKSNNEEKSADLAVKRLSAINFPVDKINTCRQQIIATKSHLSSMNKDTNLFTDADLSILGQPTDAYRQYCAQIRKEYSIYPDIVYKPGRKKVVIHFLNMGKIFKTSYFSDEYELQARKNLESELNML